jgi:hypothetical protein
MSRRKPYKPLIPPSTPGQKLLADVLEAVLDAPKASWDARIKAAIMLVSIDCGIVEAQDALQPTYESCGRAEFGSSDHGNERQASFARNAVEKAARRLQDARANAEWEREENSRLEKRKSHLRVLAGGAR